MLTKTSTANLQSEIDQINEQAYRDRGKDIEQSISLSKQAYRQSEEIGYDKGKARSLANLSHFFAANSEYNPAMGYAEQALQILKDEPDDSIKASVYFTLGIVNHRQGNFQEAIQQYLRCLEISQHTGDKVSEGNALKNIGLVYSRFGEPAKALENLNRMLALSRETGDKGGESNALSFIARLLAEKGQIAEATHSVEESIKLKQEINDERGLAVSYNSMGQIKLKTNHTLEAREFFNKAMEISERLRDPFLKTFQLIEFAKLENEEQQYEKSLALLEQAEELATEINARETLIAINHTRYVAHHALKNYERALEYYIRYHNIQSDVMGMEVSGKIRSQEAAYRSQIAEKEAEVYRLRNVELAEKNKEIAEEKHKSDELLLNILPEEIANELKTKGSSPARNYDLATVIFTDFEGFTHIAEKMDASKLVEEIHHCFKKFDEISAKYKIEKIKTIGDAYMAAGGLPNRNKCHPEDVVNAGLEIRDFMLQYAKERKAQNLPYFEARIGIHIGPVVAGIVGIKKFAYDIWGDTVNTAARMESSGKVGKVNASGETYEMTKDKFRFTHRGKVDAKNKGEIDMYFVDYL